MMINEKLDNYLKGVASYGNVLSPVIFSTVKFLLTSVFCHYKHLCETLHPTSHIHVITCFMDTTPFLLHTST